GRGFGGILIFLLLAGEYYSTFTLLGASGWAYSKGAPSLYVIAYVGLACFTSYWLMPPIWRYAKKHNLVSQSEFFASKYKSSTLGVLVTLVGVLSLVPYIVLQFKGLGIIVSVTSYGEISPTVAICIGMIVMFVYVMISGIHGSAMNAAIKDILSLVVIVFMGLYLPFHYYGGMQEMFEAIEQAKPNFLALPSEGMSISWFISTVLLTTVGFYMWPHGMSAAFSAKNEKVFRSNAIVMPLYGLILLFAFFVGFASILQVPGLVGAESDLALLKLTMQTFDPWFVGLLGAAGLLCALVPGSLMLMASATMLAKNIYGAIYPQASGQKIARVAKIFVAVISVIALILALDKGNSLGALFLISYSLVTQLFPAFICSLFTNNFITKQGAFAGIVCGVATVMYVTITKTSMGALFPSAPQAIQDLNIGLIAMIFNFSAMILVSLVTRRSKAILSEKKAA
ncbi:MAG: sodium:solute symporter family protein, partial [Clostridia bacterium]